MRKNRIIAGCVVLAIVMSLCSMKPALAVSKKIISLDANPTYINTRFIPVEKGKTYQIYDFLKSLKTGISVKEKEELRDAVQKKKLVSLSGNGLKIKKQTFRANKQGDYFLRVETKKNNYVFPICVVDCAYKIPADEVAGVSIAIHIMGKETRTMVTDGETVRQIVGKINQVKYMLDFAGCQKKRTGFGGYYVNVHMKDGVTVKKLAMDMGGFRERDEMTVFGIRWKGNTNLAKECYDYIGEVFNNVYPEHRGHASTC